MTHILDLPNEIFIHIAYMQKPCDQNAFLRTNKRLASLLNPGLIGRVCALRDEQAGKSGIYFAASRGDRAMVRRFVDGGALEFVAGGAVLNDAVMSLDVSVFRFLIDCGIDPETRDKNGQTPFSVACQHNRLDAVKLLYADPRVNVDSGDRTGRTPLSHAAGGGHVQILRVLLAPRRVR
ncbi:ankyrin repeat-containing domain protein [Tuber indicum]|nr:ankyrin repeat-containing domain protein [Tuber indicum]